MRDVVTGLHELEQRSSHVTAEVHNEMQAMRAESERMMGGLFDEASGKNNLTSSRDLNSLFSAICCMSYSAVRY
jgi:hypothetical protein